MLLMAISVWILIISNPALTLRESKTKGSLILIDDYICILQLGLLICLLSTAPRSDWGQPMAIMMAAGMDGPPVLSN